MCPRPEGAARLRRRATAATVGLRQRLRAPSDRHRGASSPMCTVIIQIGESPSDPVRMLAIRDEDPGRPWNPLGPWWPDTHEGVVGVRDVRAGGAWLAADPSARRLAVLLNR